MNLSMDPYSKIAYWHERSKSEHQEKFDVDEYYSRNEKITSNTSRTGTSEKTEFVSESQNFSLRMSDNSNAEDNNGVIIITDSSLSSTSEDSARIKQEQRTLTCIKNAKTSKIFDLDSSDSDSFEMKSDNVSSARKPMKLDSMRARQEQIYRKLRGNYNTSDKYNKSSSSSNDQLCNEKSHKQKNHSDDILVNPTPDVPEHDGRNTPTRINKTPTLLNREPLVISSSLDSQSSSSCAGCWTHIKRTDDVQTHTKSTERGKTVKDKFTKRDLRTILDNIKSSKAVYESPRQKNNVIIDESMDSCTHPAMSNKDDIIARTDTRNNNVIAETYSEFENEILSSQMASVEPQRTPIQRLYYKPQEKTAYSLLSERKKKEISHWLTTTPSRYSNGDSSLSNVPATNRSSISSGNSSLERLEMNYETPNNRGRIQKAAHQTPQQKTDINYDRPENSTLNKQTTLNMVVQKSMDSRNRVLGYQTPNQPMNRHRSKKDDHVTGAFTDLRKRSTPKEMNVAECAEILGQLYGDEWRSKADELLPTSEPRRQNIKKIDRAVQTERKKKSRQKRYTSDSEDDDSIIFAKNTEPPSNSTKKGRSRNKTRKNSFINDESTSGSDTDSMYHTALTHPRISTNNEQRKKPTQVSGITKRIFAICDSETDDEKPTSIRKDGGNIDRKLLYSDDEDNSSTSEFDPGDHVPPKSIRKKGTERVQRQVPKLCTSKTTVSSNNHGNQENSFLSSLSDTVPLVNAHPDAKKYRTNYKNTKLELSKKLYALYNEKVFDNKLPDDMQIEWNIRMRGTAGFCYNRKSVKHLSGVQKSSRIVLATKILDTPDRLRDTLLHEMCHAAAWLINNVSDGHGPFWREWANKAMKVFPELPPIRRCHDYKVKTKFTYRCTGCAYSIGRHSKSLDIEKKRCGHCYGKFELLINKTTKDGIVQAQTPKRGPSAFALYVKEHYGNLRKQSNKNHAEIMKLLGQQFSAIKIAKKQDSEKENYSDTHIF